LCGHTEKLVIVYNINPKLSGKKINENVILANKPRNSPPFTEDEDLSSDSRRCPLLAVVYTGNFIEFHTQTHFS
jgi:hypothetical protein